MALEPDYPQFRVVKDNIEWGSGMSLLDPTRDWPEEARSLRRFGAALMSDGQINATIAAAVVDALINRAVLAVRNEDGPQRLNRRARLLSLFVQYHRRHMRLRALEIEEDFETLEHSEGSFVARVIATMPLELREALLLVVLERLTHVEAAAVLEIPLGVLIERLARARAILSRATGAAFERRSWSGPTPHLRLVK
jgi:DNA-directed RNA polymerase specialized sigma24 family protein